MNFTPKKTVGTAVGAILTIAVVGLIGWGRHNAPEPTPIVEMKDNFTVGKPFQTDDVATIFPAVQITPARGSQVTRAESYQPVASWYKSKHWWKRNAPIVGGAGGGALVGGLVGGGAGAIIGGAAGGGGGYLYKRTRHHHHPNRYNHR